VYRTKSLARIRGRAGAANAVGWPDRNHDGLRQRRRRVPAVGGNCERVSAAGRPQPSAQPRLSDLAGRWRKRPLCIGRERSRNGSKVFSICRRRKRFIYSGKKTTPSESARRYLFHSRRRPAGGNRGGGPAAGGEVAGDGNSAGFQGSREVVQDRVDHRFVKNPFVAVSEEIEL